MLELQRCPEAVPDRESKQSAPVALDAIHGCVSVHEKAAAHLGQELEDPPVVGNLRAPE
jgi:hypothetical protein